MRKEPNEPTEPTDEERGALISDEDGINWLRFVSMQLDEHDPIQDESSSVKTIREAILNAPILELLSINSMLTSMLASRLSSDELYEQHHQAVLERNGENHSLTEKERT
jgi:hypothetical protein